MSEKKCNRSKRCPVHGKMPGKWWIDRYPANWIKYSYDEIVFSRYVGCFEVECKAVKVEFPKP